jgi:hypothetical protein
MGQQSGSKRSEAINTGRSKQDIQALQFKQLAKWI